jgi:hypothetical protein
VQAPAIAGVDVDAARSDVDESPSTLGDILPTPKASMPDQRSLHVGVDPVQLRTPAAS